MVNYWVLHSMLAWNRVCLFRLTPTVGARCGLMVIHLNLTISTESPKKKNPNK
jgi:hypothetical protein